ncbi:hypothetical protein G6F56_010257 [Rhizopus delemar]|uniref:Late embryogenesis abundant protein LEA-2 subgroup domain-containing protein n=1 Tax=Rhizopus stolonifer TaxID=4846 RepID=A0A367IKV9_RHIST|nr:hypothetical protein G6F56_010257 [Rhizopus delemar]RCH78300.1 hypothetical protein CU098_005621 [Rhizopus stolonifer]
MQDITRYHRGLAVIEYAVDAAHVAHYVIVLAAMFKSPQVDFTGIQGTPSFAVNGTVLNLNLNLGFTVYYHGFNNTSIGSGTLNDLHISSNAHTNIQFPFLISIDASNNNSKTIATQLLSDCGVGGATQQKINLDYKVVATVKLFSFNIHVPYSSSVDFDCPMSTTTQQEILNTIGKTLLGLVSKANGVLGSLGL